MCAAAISAGSVIGATPDASLREPSTTPVRGRPISLMKAHLLADFASRVLGSLVHRGGQLAALAGVAVLAGCAAPAANQVVAPAAAQSPAEFKIEVGDVLKISFPGAPNLDSTQSVRRDGKVTLSMAGEVQAGGLTPAQLEKELLRLYAGQLVSNEVSVLVVSSSFPVFVSGAVLRPGKIVTDRPLSALEAVMEAGGFAEKADMAAVRIVRQEEGATRNYTLDLKSVLEGKSTEPFYLRRSDIVFVPEKFSWF